MPLVSCYPVAVMEIYTQSTEAELGREAARLGANRIRAAINETGRASIVVATGTSQFSMLACLVEEDLDWEKVTAFHLDEYVGLPVTHPASFRNYLRERFVAPLPSLSAFHEINGEADPAAECDRLNALISARPVDVLFAGIGENAHLAFNDPPADFATTQPFIVVTLDEACRAQQVGEGWFPSVQDVPAQAISMSIQQIIAARCVVLSVPGQRKAEAVRCAISGAIDADCPASILQAHGDCHIFLDRDSASRLSGR